MSSVLAFEFSTISKAGLQAGNLSLVNMIPLFAGAHLSFLADLLGLPLDAYRRVHRSAGLMTFALILFHVLVVVANRTSFSLGVPEHLFGLIVSSCCYFHRRS
jgi:Ferric reductase like transmembrane component